MATTLFVSATNTNVGKTTCARLLAKYCNTQNIKTILLKPIETGINPLDKSSDAHLFLQDNHALDKSMQLQDISFYRYIKACAPLIAQQEEKPKKPIELNKIKDLVEHFKQRYDLIIVEGAGGLLVPITLKESMLDLALNLEAKMLLISHDNLGMINDCLLNDYLLKSQKLDYKIAINLRESNATTFESVSLPYIELFNKHSNNPIMIFQKNLKELMDFALK
ncbi:dethiobiotin synthase [Helicobacter cetorum]|uniref:ATP-dependent dethiobiotin synthetase BioD n=1 Tax=Helicobacter cetorum (strain ATCC BAA-540 / CCUG 52418 / MIT 99-5656) TaxID=1163745 RepID=I0EQ39_HELCM|nr:dethiobiotin synthase [Helicobacter cetorum]AFI05058.1 dethiobiotin synthetase [Helicobacter cetorum MIT 99-5656]